MRGFRCGAECLLNYNIEVLSEWVNPGRSGPWSVAPAFG